MPKKHIFTCISVYNFSGTSFVLKLFKFKIKRNFVFMFDVEKRLLKSVSVRGNQQNTKFQSI